MFRQDRTNPSTAISNWRGRHDTPKGWPSTAVSSWLNGGLFGAGAVAAAGYFAGGYNDITGAHSTVDRFLFADDSRTVLGTGLSSARYSLAGMGSAVAGYAGGGYVTGQVATVDRFLFTDDSRTTLGTGLSTANYELTAMASSVAGYFCGGWDTSAITTTVDRFLFSNDSRTTLGTGLSAPTYDSAGMASSVAGYVGGGYDTTGAGAVTTTVDRFLFSNDSRTTLGTGLSAATYRRAAMASSVAGYFVGGRLGSPTWARVTTVDRFLFSNDSRTTLGTGLSTATADNSGMASETAGYSCGGDAGGTSFTTVDRFLFDDDSRTTLGTGLSAGRQGGTAFAAIVA